MEEQIEAAERRRPGVGPVKSTEEVRVERERASIEMTRTRILRELEAATHPRHRAQLEAALQHLQEKMVAAGLPLE